MPDSPTDTLHQACAEFDTQGQLVRATPSLLAMFGAAVLHPGAPLSLLAGHLKLETLLLCRTGPSDIGELTSAISVNVPTCNGLRDLRVTGVFTPRPEGSQARRVIVQEITDPAAVLASRAQQEPLRRFLCHDLRAPIATMISELRQETRKSANLTGAGTKMQMQMQMQLQQQATQLLAMVDDFALAVAADQGQLHWTESLLENLLEDAIGNALPQLKTKGQSVQAVAACEAIFVNTDCQLMVRALVYLISKAADIAPPGSQITLEVRSSQNAQENVQPATSVVIALLHSTSQSDSPQAASDSYPVGLRFVQNVVRQHCGILSQEQACDGRHKVSLRLPCAVHR